MQNSTALLPNADRARVISLMLYLTIGLSVLSIFLIGREVLVFQNMQAGIYLEKGAADFHNGLRALGAGARFVLLILSAVFFVRWMVRAHHNYQAAGGLTVFSKSTVQWAFFIPFVNLGRPYQVVREFWHGMFEKVRGFSFQESQFQQVVVGWWWVIWLISGSLGNVSRRIQDPGNMSMMVMSNYFEIAYNLAQIISGWLIIAVIKEFTQLEEESRSMQRIEDLAEPDEANILPDSPT